MAVRCSSSTRILSSGLGSDYLSSFSSSGCRASQQSSASSRTGVTMYSTLTSSSPSSQLSIDGRSISAVTSGLYVAEILKLRMLLKTSSSGLNLQKYATINSMVQKGEVEGNAVKNVLKDLIHYNSRRKFAFQPKRSSRLSVMSKNQED
ncbi:hypothetical protein FRX31_017664 [Thalictrum thalictroides]|uniref:Uncharacterized protein n=1 Tax=Thalictrum thalictroides TaxID=46969 RepID=A0A7J6W5W9_THATH|nr:hypothetical protein FRX31_017664 [Thalictrum thalictroides]